MIGLLLLPPAILMAANTPTSRVHDLLFRLCPAPEWDRIELGLLSNAGIGRMRAVSCMGRFRGLDVVDPDSNKHVFPFALQGPLQVDPLIPGLS